MFFDIKDAFIVAVLSNSLCTLFSENANTYKNIFNNILIVSSKNSERKVVVH